MKCRRVPVVREYAAALLYPYSSCRSIGDEVEERPQRRIAAVTARRRRGIVPIPPVVVIPVPVPVRTAWATRRRGRRSVTAWRRPVTMRSGTGAAGTESGAGTPRSAGAESWSGTAGASRTECRAGTAGARSAGTERGAASGTAAVASGCAADRGRTSAAVTAGASAASRSAGAGAGGDSQSRGEDGGKGDDAQFSAHRMTSFEWDHVRCRLERKRRPRENAAAGRSIRT